MLIEDIYNGLKASPPKPRIQDKAEVDRTYKYWRLRVMYSLFIGYAIFYFCRKNISIALPALASDLGYSNAQLGLLGSLLYITYGIGKFVNGIMADRANPRYFMVIGLVLSAFVNILFGLSSSLWFLAFYWGLNGWFQSMGFPPCARLLANWYSVSERGVKWSIWHVSHQVGGVIISVMAGYLIQHYGWRSSFIVPAVICLVVALFLYNRLRDTPPSMGLPDISEYRGDYELNRDGSIVTEEPETIKQILIHRVLTNKYIWLISLMNLFVYIVRTGVFDWATKFLVETKQSQVAKAGIVVSMIELAGIAGPLLSGFVTDKLTKGRRGPMCAISFILSIVGMLIFYYTPAGHPYIDGFALATIGFWIYGPQFLVGVFVTDFASRKAASTAIGLTGVFGYIGAALSGAPNGWLIDKFGWGGGFVFWIGSAVIGGIIALMMWNTCPMTHKNKQNSCTK